MGGFRGCFSLCRGSAPDRALTKFPLVQQAHRAWLQDREYSASTINQRLAAIRKLAREAALNGVLAPEIAAGIGQGPGIKQRGTRTGNWLTRKQAQALINLPDPRSLKGKRDRAVLALLIGCALRRSETVWV